MSTPSPIRSSARARGRLHSLPPPHTLPSRSFPHSSTVRRGIGRSRTQTSPPINPEQTSVPGPTVTPTAPYVRTHSSSAIDEYSILHVVAGFLMTFVLQLGVGISVILHQVFELWQNSPARWWVVLRPWSQQKRLESNELDAATEIVANSAMDTLLFTVGALCGAALLRHRRLKKRDPVAVCRKACGPEEDWFLWRPGATGSPMSTTSATSPL